MDRDHAHPAAKHAKLIDGVEGSRPAADLHHRERLPLRRAHHSQIQAYGTQRLLLSAAANCDDRCLVMPTLTKVLCDGARVLLTQALEAEVGEFLAATGDLATAGAAGLGNAFQSRGDVDAVIEEHCAAGSRLCDPERRGERTSRGVAETGARKDDRDLSRWISRRRPPTLSRRR